MKCMPYQDVFEIYNRFCNERDDELFGPGLHKQSYYESIEGYNLALLSSLLFMQLMNCCKFLGNMYTCVLLVFVQIIIIFMISMVTNKTEQEENIAEVWLIMNAISSNLA